MWHVIFPSQLQRGREAPWEMQIAASPLLFLWTTVQKSRGIWVALGHLEIKEANHICKIQLWYLMRTQRARLTYIRRREFIWSKLTLLFMQEFKGTPFETTVSRVLNDPIAWSLHKGVWMISVIRVINMIGELWTC